MSIHDYNQHRPPVRHEWNGGWSQAWTVDYGLSLPFQAMRWWCHSLPMHVVSCATSNHPSIGTLRRLPLLVASC